MFTTNPNSKSPFWPVYFKYIAFVFYLNVRKSLPILPFSLRKRFYLLRPTFWFEKNISIFLTDPFCASCMSIFSVLTS